MRSTLLRRLLAGIALGAMAATFAATPSLAATTDEMQTPATATHFDASDIDSFAGAFLAARIADFDKDGKSAVDFYRKALEFDPDNTEVKERLMVTLFINDRFDEGVEIANELKNDPAVDRITAVARGIDAMQKHQYQRAAKLFEYGGTNDLDRLMNALLAAWADFGAGNKQTAIKSVKDLKGPDWFAIFKNYNIGLMAAASGRKTEARDAFNSAITDQVGGGTAPDTYMRAVMALAALESNAGRKQQALDVVATGEKFSPGYPPLEALRQEISAGKVDEKPVTTAAEGAASVLFSVGSALNRQGAEEVVALYLNFSRALDPKNPATLVMLGSIADALDKHDRAIALYKSIPEGSPMRRLSDLQLGLDLAQIGKVDEAKKQLNALIDQDPKDMRSYLALGSVLSQAKDYQAMADVYDRAVQQIGPVASSSDWNIYFQRGIAYERLKEWQKAEPNFQKSLQLSPDQPQVLNYLGYSWIDRNMNLNEGMKMIKKAVELSPNDGYIVDSLGWAYYKVGQFDKAVDELEHAVELKPEDATINDHLGDAYWQVGRKLEATYQWNRALTFKPEKDQIPLIKAKIKNGLPAPVNGRPVNIEAEMKDQAPPPAKPAATPDSNHKSQIEANPLTRIVFSPAGRATGATLD
ncbi:MAG: tetratricopeptide repeat protein [Pararhizobium sp.]